MGRDFVLGAVFGEWGAEENGSIIYAGGWIASGVVVIGDIRDIAATIANGDLVGTGLNIAGLIPAYGDAAKAGEIIGKFVVKHPEVLKPAMSLLVGVTHSIDEAAELMKNLRSIHGDTLINALEGKGLSAETIDRLHNLHQAKKIVLQHIDEGLGIVRGTGKIPKQTGDVAEFIAHETIIKARFPPSSGYTYEAKVLLQDLSGNALAEMDHVIMRDGIVVAFSQTKNGMRRAWDANEQIKKSFDAINGVNSERFVKTNIEGLTPDKFRATTLEAFTIGQKNGYNYDCYLEYTSTDMREIFNTIRFG